MAITVQVAQRGVVTLPKTLRDAYNVRAGDLYTVIDMGDGSFRFVPRQLKIDALSDEIRTALEEKGGDAGKYAKSLARTTRKRCHSGRLSSFLTPAPFLPGFIQA